MLFPPLVAFLYYSKCQMIFTSDSTIYFQLFHWIKLNLSPSLGTLKMLIIFNWNMWHFVVPIIGCLCINYTVLRLWGVNSRERRWWKDCWWQNYEILTSSHGDWIGAFHVPSVCLHSSTSVYSTWCIMKMCYVPSSLRFITVDYN